MTTASSSLEVVRVIDENPTNLNDYGLVQPADRDRLQGRDKTVTSC